MSHLEQARRLLKIAKRDVKTFLILRGACDAPEVPAYFHAQQAVEKSLKAVLLWHGVPVRKTHDLDELVDLLLDKNIPMPFPPDKFSYLNPFAVIYRYEDIEYAGITLEEAATLVEIAVNWASHFIEKPV